MELYINSNWTKCYANAYIAEAIAWSENGNHATIYTTGITAKEADDNLKSALRELKLIPETSEMVMKDEQKQGGRRFNRPAISTPSKPLSFREHYEAATCLLTLGASPSALTRCAKVPCCRIWSTPYAA